MDTKRAKEQLAFISDEICNQAALRGNRLRLYISPRLLERYGDKIEAYDRLLAAVIALEEITKAIHLKFNFINAEHDQFFIDVDLDKDFFKVPALLRKPKSANKLKYDAVRGTLYLGSGKVQFEPKTVKSVILSLCLAQPEKGVGIDRIIDKCEKVVDREKEFSDRKIRDDIKSINEKVSKTLPFVTIFLQFSGGYARVNPDILNKS